MVHRDELYVFFFFNDTATTEIYTLSLHDALPIYTNKQKVEFQALVALNAARMYFQEKNFKSAHESFLKVYKDHRSEEHTSELQSRQYLVCCVLLETNSLNATSWKDWPSRS